MKLTSSKSYLKIVVIIIALLFVIIAVVWSILRGYSANWTGFGDFTTSNGEFVRSKTLWDWMELLVIPLVLVIGAFYLNQSERVVERQTAEDRLELEHEIATDRQQETALQAYLDRMTDLLLRYRLQTSNNAEVRNVARIRTLTVLRGLDAKRKGIVVLFLHESELVNEQSVISLSGADLSEVDLVGANLMGANLSGAYLVGANLNRANLSTADLSTADLRLANLKESNLNRTNLSEVDLDGADLRKANLMKATLNKAKMFEAKLHGANLSEADLNGADLWETDLTGAKVCDEQFTAVKSLRGATMPDGTKHD